MTSRRPGRPAPEAVTTVPGRRATSVEPTIHLPSALGPSRSFDPAWCLVADPDPDDARITESLFCLADGVVGTRGVREEDPCPAVRPVTASCLYEPASVVSERPMPVPTWLALPIAPGLPVGRRVLDLRDGLLIRDASGPGGQLRSARFACAESPGTSVFVSEVDPALVHMDLDDPGPHVGHAEQASPLGGGVALATSTTWRPSDSQPGGPVTIERLASYAVSARSAPTAAAATRLLQPSVQLGPAALLTRQRTTWSQRWSDGDVEIVGDIDATLAVRASLFHLISSATRRGEAAISARGLTGPGYAGHVFWDTDAFVVPVLSAVDPRAARAALEYRIRRLEPARRRAARHGHNGARFPWESASTGEDVTPKSGVDHNGRTTVITTGDLEEHVTSVVAWSAWNYACWHGGWGFLEGPGRPLLLETARYWASRLCCDREGVAHIDGVSGPDEYHGDVDDNAFTNLMARWNLRRGAELLDRIGTDGGEAADWRAGAEALADQYDARSGRYEQFAGYDALEPLKIADIGTPPINADVVLGPVRLSRSQIIKQADVLMAHFLIPDGVADGSLLPNLDHYLPRTAHGSSLSPGVHATLLARAGRPDEALALFRLAASIDLGDRTGGTAEGLHMANLGGMWHAVVRGFVGLTAPNLGDRVLALAPHLPDGWEEIRIRFRWRRARIALRCRRDAVHVACDRPITVTIHGVRAKVEPPGRWVG